MHLLTNPRMRYAWGSVDLLPTLLGEAPDGRPVAEIWMGAHPAAPSLLDVDGRPERLDAFVARHPGQALGARADDGGEDEGDDGDDAGDDAGERAGMHSARLPFLLKLLAAGEPLSLQVHPDGAQAAAGHRRENAAGIALTDPRRSYPDDSPKPEMVYALTSFELLCGFAPVDRVRALLTGLAVTELQPLVDALRSPDPAVAIESAVTRLLTAARPQQRDLVRAVARVATARRDDRREYALVGDLATRFPDDVGIVATLFLNQLRIEPGESVFIGAGTIHSYVSGLGLELMAPSDNVLRAGLTAKHVDVRELLRLVDFTPRLPQRLRPTADDGAVVFRPPGPGFALWTSCRAPTGAAAGPAEPVAVPGPASGPRIAVACAGRATLARGDERLELAPGQSAFIPDSDGPLEISTTGTTAVAFCP
ncbi:mannose-6-phosphate isomerase, class I [Pengzhenrongella sicca]|uniref:mannose-6-phosphate isomerase n=1 Tax=Pengzhenrongella sicca TaxID=2819238 RepID=A0A8A4ZGQ9_9MICO|nr:mannose-6-phosphate isomerase, class I [Pengzhenrongella sicca]QTE30179.1 mannose-6-phosphate isomerase, class I [Pengzhenrongella sicca]